MAVDFEFCEEAAGFRGDFFDFDGKELGGVDGKDGPEDLPEGALIDECL